MSRPHHPDAGLRWSALDDLVLTVGVLLTGIAFACHLDDAALVIVTVTGHFVVFCNIVRLRRSLELVWAGGYIAAGAILTALDAFHAARLALVIAPATLILVAIEVASARYHGVGWQVVNPRWQPANHGLPAARSLSS